MRFILVTLIMLFAGSFSMMTYAGPPVITNNVVVKKNVTADQCPSDYKGSGGDAIDYTVSGEGQSNANVSVGVLSCTGCVYNPNDKSCTCATCYNEFDN